VFKVPKVVPCGYLLHQYRRGATALCSPVLIEPLAITEKIETTPVFVKFLEPIRWKRRQRVLIVQGIPLAPIKQRKEKSNDRDAVHGIAGGDLTNLAGLGEGTSDTYANGFPIFE
jgi:hypothetical protein